jgi:CubicO group peptidase (beta-lactamase class C family)
MVDAKQIATQPSEVDIDAERLEELFAAVQRDVDEGRLPSAQVALGRGGRLAGMRSFGEATQGGTRGPVSDQTLYCFYSVSKGVSASMAWALIEEGLLRPEERVGEIVPALAEAPLAAVTVEQLLTFTCGFPEAPMHPRLWEDRQARVERMKGWRLMWEPGSRYEYHHTSAHWLLGEIVAQRTGKDFRDYFRERIALPAGLPDLYLGLPDEQHGRVADVEFVQAPAEAGGGEVTAETTIHFNYPQQRRGGAPAGGVYTTAGDIALYYQVLVNGGQALDGTRVLAPETISEATRVHTQEHHVDAAHGVPANRGWSIAVAGDDGNAHLRGFGDGAPPRAFGHGGLGGQIGLGDPDSGLSLAFCTNGITPPDEITERTRALASLAWRCAV